MQIGYVEDFVFVFFMDQVDYFVDGQMIDQFVVFVYYWCGNQVVMFECLGGVVVVFVWVEGYWVGGYDFQYLFVWIVDQQVFDWQYVFEYVVVVDYEQFVGMFGQFFQVVQVVQYYFQVDVFVDGDYFEVYQCVDLVFFVGQC